MGPKENVTLQRSIKRTIKRWYNERLEMKRERQIPRKCMQESQT